MSDSTKKDQQFKIIVWNNEDRSTIKEVICTVNHVDDGWLKIMASYINARGTSTVFRVNYMKAEEFMHKILGVEKI